MAWQYNKRERAGLACQGLGLKGKTGGQKFGVGERTEKIWE
jgi:hypothetical protein